MNNVANFLASFTDERFCRCSRDWKKPNQMLWRWQNSNVINALIVGIGRFINGGVPIGGISILLAHTAILSRN